jgi:hypothetical protein
VYADLVRWQAGGTMNDDQTIVAVKVS